ASLREQAEPLRVNRFQLIRHDGIIHREPLRFQQQQGILIDAPPSSSIWDRGLTPAALVRLSG
ncbi:hypothetical protein AB4142_32700, partial [Variovorax sp. 2RAF20]